MKKQIHNQHMSESSALDDEQRIKVLSPSMLVIKRFMRNKLAIAGFIIIAFMFLFAFLGGVITPYKEAQVFKIYENMSKDYAGATMNSEYRYIEKDGETLPFNARTAFILALNNSQQSFESDGIIYGITQLGDHLYELSKMYQAAMITVLKGTCFYEPTNQYVITDSLKVKASDAINQGASSFVDEGKLYTLSKQGRTYQLNTGAEIALASYVVFDTATNDTSLSYDFRKNAELSFYNKALGFEADGKTYSLSLLDKAALIYDDETKKEYAIMSTLIIQPISTDVFLTLDFKTAISKAIDEGVSSFKYNQGNEEVEYEVLNSNGQYRVRKETLTEKISLFEAPSSKHWLGTDGNGMDICTRLMYGGRISLMIGFIVVIIEVILGVILGGVAGYFSGWIDTIIMRVVDIFNCIPQIPLIIILGSIMDSLKVDPKIRIYYLMLVLGILGWPGVARIVRGQILSLREQEFMTATEATGLCVRRRIFKHLVPNVIPQLIVIATMSLGNIILTESTLSFLGLGVKFPFASWGNIINAVTDVHVMTECWFVWIPAGICILLTVLGFNFIGDGLRDAFDPKMKR